MKINNKNNHFILIYVTHFFLLIDPKQKQRSENDVGNEMIFIFIELLLLEERKRKITVCLAIYGNSVGIFGHKKNLRTRLTLTQSQAKRKKYILRKRKEVPTSQFV